MTHYITYKVKIDNYQHVASMDFKPGFKVKKTVTKTDCTMKNSDHKYYNSDLFPKILNNQHKVETRDRPVLFLDDLPNGITVENQGFLSLVKIPLPELFK